MKKVFIGTDHAGFEYKEAIKEALIADGYEVIDKGNTVYEELDDYPDFIYPVAKAVSEDLENSMGIVHSSRGHLNPASKELLSEIEIVNRLAMAVFKGNNKKLKYVDWEDMTNDYGLIRNYISKVIPGFQNFTH